MSSDIYPSFSRLSFNAIELPSLRSNLPENLILKPHRSSDSTFWQKTGLSFRDFSLIHHIGSDNIEKVYLCRLRPDKSYFYAMKIVDKQLGSEYRYQIRILHRYTANTGDTHIIHIGVSDIFEILNTAMIPARYGGKYKGSSNKNMSILLLLEMDDDLDGGGSRSGGCGSGGNE
ncbi:hypothetical protein LguiB_015306 [Lonicera macranthoides]